MPVAGQLLDDVDHARRQHVRALGKDVRQFRAQEAGTLSYRDPALQQEGANLVDDAGALADQPLTHPMQRLQVELLGCLGGNKFHRRTLYRLRNRFAVAEVILLSFCIRPDVFRRHQPRIMAERLQFAAQVMCTNTSFHPDQARWHVGEPRLLGRVTISAAARSRRADRGRRHGTNSCRYRCPSWQRSNWIGWTWQCSFKVPSQRHSPVR